jgi:hypothetical protein
MKNIIYRGESPIINTGIVIFQRAGTKIISPRRRIVKMMKISYDYEG